MDKSKIFKAHPIMLFSFMRPFLFVLIIPFITAAVQYIKKGQVSGFFTLEAITLSLITVISLARTFSFSLTVEKKYILVKSGIFLKKTARIPKKRISCVTVRRNIADIIFKSATYELNTEAGSDEKTDLSFKLKLKDSYRLSNMLYIQKNFRSESFSPLKIALLSASSSSLITGVLVGAPVINLAGRLLGLSVAELLLDRISKIASAFSRYLPPTINIITTVVVLIYGISFANALLKNTRFRLKNGETEVEVDSGLAVRNCTIFSKKDVNCLILEQTPLMHLFKAFTLSVAVGGYKILKGKKPVVIPCEKEERITSIRKKLFPYLNEESDNVTALYSVRDKSRFAFVPVLFYLLILAVVITVGVLFNEFFYLALFLGFVAAVINTYYLYISLFECKKGRLAIGDNILLAFGLKGTKVNMLLCQKENVAEIKMCQTPADRRHSTCKLKIVVRGEGSERIRVRNLDYNDTLQLIKKNFE